MIAIPTADPIIPASKELLLLPSILLIVEVLDTPPVIAEIMLIAIPIILIMMVIIHAHPFPLNRPYDITKYPVPITSSTAPRAAKSTPKTDPMNADPSEISACRLEINTPRITDDIPANTDIIPRITVRIAMIVTPVGRLGTGEVNLTKIHMITMVKNIAVNTANGLRIIIFRVALFCSLYSSEDVPKQKYYNMQIFLHFTNQRIIIHYILVLFNIELRRIL